MHIHLPNSAFLGNIDPFLHSFNPTHESTLTITSNKKWISVHPMVLAMIGSLGQELPAESITLEPVEAKSKNYFQRIGLYSMLKKRSSATIRELEPTGRFIPLTKISHGEELSSFIQDMIPLLHVSPETAEPLKYVVSELVRNVLEHASSPVGAIVCAQYYKKSNRISIGIVDRGVGIRETIRHSHRAQTHGEALRLALTPGITGTTRREGGTAQNAGAGLFFIKSIATVNRDYFVIYSGNAMYKLLKGRKIKMMLYPDPLDDRHSLQESFPYWKGTAVGIDISLDAREEFTDLLELIRETFSKAVRERKKERFKKPRFI
jgi:anti-sigma regulatory factor (Ser/Thr protein kinase)